MEERLENNIEDDTEYLSSKELFERRMVLGSFLLLEGIALGLMGTYEDDHLASYLSGASSIAGMYQLLKGVIRR